MLGRWKTFFNTSEVTLFSVSNKNVFQLVNIHILTTNLYLVSDNTCNYMFSNQNAGARKRTRNIFKSFVRSLLYFLVQYWLYWLAEIGIFNDKLDKYLFRSKYGAVVCPQINYINQVYNICCLFYHFWYMQVTDKMIFVTNFIYVIAVSIVLQY